MEIGLANLLDKGFIERYEVAGFSVISLPNFTRHQSPHSTEKDSELPDCNGYLTVNERARGRLFPVSNGWCMRIPAPVWAPITVF